MINFLLYIFLGIVTIGISVFGGHVSSNNRKHRYMFYIFGVIGVILITLTGYQNYLAQIEGDKSRKQLADSIVSLKNSSLAIANMSKEALRIGSLNTKLQERAIKSSSTIKELSEEAIKTTTGSDTFCLAMIDPPRNPYNTDKDEIWAPVFEVIGKYPLYGVTARIIDREDLKRLDYRYDYWKILSTGRFIKLGDISNRAIGIRVDVPISVLGGYKSFVIHYSARNGNWFQFLRIKKINGKWVQATQVTRGEGAKYKIIFERIDPDFPMEQNGHINWGED